MTLFMASETVEESVAALRAWARWPGRDEERLRIYAEGSHRTVLLSADTGETAATESHRGEAHRMLVDVSGYVVRIDLPVDRVRDGKIAIVPRGNKTALLTIDGEPFILLAQDEEVEAEAPVVIALGGVPRLRAAESVAHLTIIDVDNVSGIEAFTGLRHIGLRAAVWLTDVTPVAGLKSLESISLKRARRLEDLEPLKRCALRRLDLQGCERVSNLGPLKTMTSLEYLNVWRLPLLEDLSALRNLTSLQELQFSRSRKLTDLTPLAGLASLEILCLAHCEAVEDIAPLATVPTLRELDLSGCDRLTDIGPLAMVHGLETLVIEGCHRLVDLGPLAQTTGLRHLDMTSCDGAEDLSPLAGLPQLERIVLGGDRNSGSTRRTLAGLEGSAVNHLTLTRCTDLDDLGPLTEAANLEVLDLVHCQALRDISPLSGLPLRAVDLEGCLSLKDISPVRTMGSLRELCLNDCAKITDLSGLSDARSLERLELRGCSGVTSLHAIEGMPNLRYLDVRGCQDLSDPSRWGPLWTLPLLAELRGAFPSAVYTQVLASAAAARRDNAYVEARLAGWVDTATGAPDSAGILSAVGQACALVGANREMVALLTIAKTVHCEAVGGLMAAAAECAGAPEVRSALSQMVQGTEVLPPALLCALADALPRVRDRTWAMPLARSLRGNVLLSLAPIVAGGADDPGWALETAEALRLRIDGLRNDLVPDGCTVDAASQTAVIQAIAHAWATTGETPLSNTVFDSVAGLHATPTPVDAVVPVHESLLNLAFDKPGRHERVSAVIDGLSQSAHPEWAVGALDAVLATAAAVDGDVSDLQATAVSALARLGRWTAAGRVAIRIGRPQIRDTALDELARCIVDAETADAARRALDWASAMSDPVDRAERIEAVGRHPAVAADPVAYAQAIALLAAYPGHQKRVVHDALLSNPALVDAPTLDPIGPITDREQDLVRAALAGVRQAEED